MLTPDFDMRSHFAAVSEFVEAGSVENRNFWTFSAPPDTLQISDIKVFCFVIQSEGRVRETFA